jgi:Ca-activated chloride channel family protein
VAFLWPEALALLALVPLLVLAYVLVIRRKRKAALRYASLTLVKDAIGARPGSTRRRCSSSSR